MTDNSHRKKLSNDLPWNLLLGMLLIIAIVSAYWQVGEYDFVGFDDKSYVLDNHQVQAGLTVENVLWSFNVSGRSYWHPLTWLSHMLDCELYGLNPKGHHLTNLLFHLVNTLVLFLVMKRMTGTRWKSAFVASLFALHPLNVESVAWVAERKSVLSTLFWLLTMLTYYHYSRHPSILRYVWVFIVFALGLMAKPMLVTLPFVLLLLDFWPLGRVRVVRAETNDSQEVAEPVVPKSRESSLFRLLLEKVPLLALSVSAIYVTSLSVHSTGMVIPTDLIPMKLRIGNALVSYVSYLTKMIWPLNLAVFYPFPEELPLWQPIGAGLFLLCVTLLALRTWRKMPYLAVGWLWYLGTLTPVIGIKQAGLWPAIADRWVYVPLIGIFIIIAWAVEDLVEKYRHIKTVVAVAAGVVLLACATLTWKQLHHWRNTLSLFQRAIQVTESNYVAHTNVGHALMAQGKLEDAISHLTLAVEIEPTFSKAHSNLGNGLARLGKHDQAVVHLSRALQYEPDSPGIHNNLGNVLTEQGKIEEASTHYYAALQIDPQFAEAHFNLGTLRARQGRNQEALAHFSESLRLNPEFAPAHNSLGVVFARQGKVHDAIYHFKEAVRLEPNFGRAQKNLRTALQHVEQLEKSGKSVTVQ